MLRLTFVCNAEAQADVSLHNCLLHGPAVHRLLPDVRDSRSRTLVELGPAIGTATAAAGGAKADCVAAGQIAAGVWFGRDAPGTRGAAWRCAVAPSSLNAQGHEGPGEV